jgi:hypothetical protein
MASRCSFRTTFDTDVVAVECHVGCSVDLPDRAGRGAHRDAMPLAPSCSRCARSMACACRT